LVDANPKDSVILTVEDSVLILAMSARTRAVDTLAKFAAGTMTRYVIMPGRTSGLGSAVPLLAPTGDAWAVMADGSIAILHGREYRMSWINTNGTRSVSLPIPFPWKRVLDAEKQRMVDSANAEEQAKYQAALTKARQDSVAGAAVGQRRPRPVTAAPAKHYDLNTAPDYVSPFVPGRRALLPDADNNVWVRIGRPGTGDATPTYDVINRKGELIDRVRLPEGHELIGFAAGGVVYLVGHDGGKQFVEQARFK
jgi:hypothetical protein